MVSELVPNPAWVTRVIAKTYETLQDNIPPAWMPKLGDVHGLPWGAGVVAKPKEYGHGVYGAVLPTLDRGIVLKVTSDETEAQFARDIANHLVAPVCVRYYKVIETPDSHKGGRIFLLWRDSADHVGGIGVVEGDDAKNLVNYQHQFATEAYEMLARNVRNPSRTALLAVDEWVDSLSVVRDSTSASRLRALMAGMLKVWNEQRVFFGDVHSGNLGVVHGRWVITDPGHVAVISS